ncbi:MAG: hypothetical protein V1735_05585 [Nanoarchaeota archaeon]
MKKIVFIGGMVGTRFDSLMFRKAFAGYVIHEFHYNQMLIEDIPTVAGKLKGFIDSLQLADGEKIGIIGLSAGGIIADYYLKFLDSGKTDTFATVFSPFGGSNLGIFFSRKYLGIHDLTKGSALLAKLREMKIENIRMISIWSYLDYIVSGTSGRYENPKHTFFFIHSISQFWPPIAFSLKRFFDNAQAKSL